jgi:hypothetical protein
VLNWPSSPKAPRACHRFVGYLVRTFAILDLVTANKLTRFCTFPGGRRRALFWTFPFSRHYTGLTVTSTAVKTYTHAIEAIERGEIPEWTPGGEAKVPQVAKDFWRLPDDAQMIDLIRVVRADEAGHRFVNHSLANLRRDDFNPVAMVHQSAKLQGTKPGFTREESLEWARMVQEQMTGHKMLEAPASEEAKK